MKKIFFLLLSGLIPSAFCKNTILCDDNIGMVIGGTLGSLQGLYSILSTKTDPFIFLPFSSDLKNSKRSIGDIKQALQRHIFYNLMQLPISGSVTLLSILFSKHLHNCDEHKHYLLYNNAMQAAQAYALSSAASCLIAAIVAKIELDKTREKEFLILPSQTQTDSAMLCSSIN